MAQRAGHPLPPPGDARGAERRAASDHAVRKARAYVETRAWLFIESDAAQARVIAQRSGKAVYCTDTSQLVHPSPLAAARRHVAEQPMRGIAKVRRDLGKLRRRLRAAA